MAKTLARSPINLMVALILAMAVAHPVFAQGDKKSFSQQELEQLVAPIALYPDDLLGQVLMASTYPLEIVRAARWAKANPKVKGDALEAAMKKKDWDPSVKGLTAVPQTLNMMSEKLDWTQKLGDAMLDQKADVLAATQRLREKAKKLDNLESTSEQVVTTEVQASKTYIIIKPANPEVLYVPVYNPTIVYGVWPYPAYPPVAYYPPGYVAGRALWFGVGVAVGAAIWGNTRWGRGDVNINVNRYNNFNRANIRNNKWKHNARHRGAVPYRNRATGQHFGQKPRNTNRRQAHRGRANTSRKALSNRPGARGASNRGRGRSAASTSRGRSTQQKSGMNRRGGYNGVGRGKQTRNYSQRGRSSRSQAHRSRGGGRGGGRRGGGRRR